MSQPGRQSRARVIVLAVLAVATYGYFRTPQGWNENSRFDLTRSLVEHGTFEIDEYQDNTGDKAISDGRYYSDKAPGTALLAAPSYAIYYAYRLATGIPKRMHKGQVDAAPAYQRAALAWASFFSVGLISVLGLLAFYRLACRLGTDATSALLATLAWGFGSLAFPYSTLFFGHQPCAALLVITFALLADGTWRPRRVWLAGFTAGFAVVVEYPAAVAVVFLFTYACWSSRSWRVALWMCLGGLLPLVILATYQTSCFGAPWHTGYAYVENPDFAGMRTGLFGITYPTLDVVGQILFGTWRGILLLCPITAVGAFGLWRLAREGHRREAWLCIAIAVFFLLLNASYYMWWGGSSLGPRHMVPGLGFLSIGIARLRPGWPRTVAWVLLAYSIVTMLVTTAVGPEPPIETDPVLRYYWSHFLDGNLAALHNSNVGMRLGLSGLTSLLPLMVVWIGAGYGFYRWRSDGE